MYEYEAARIYGQTEHYNTGAGIAVASDDLAHLQAMFDARKGEANYALRIIERGTGKVVCEHGSVAAANRTMMAAWHRRRVAHG